MLLVRSFRKSAGANKNRADLVFSSTPPLAASRAQLSIPQALRRSYHIQQTTVAVYQAATANHTQRI
jgi:hypothetical protein